MLFSSQVFVFLFLPVVLTGFYLLRRRGGSEIVIAWLLLASIVFHAWWEPWHTVLLAGSVIANYALAHRLADRTSPASRESSRLLLTVGVTLNLMVLALFKYSGLLAQTTNAMLDAGLPVPEWALPLGISFFTFQQIAYLIDAFHGLARPPGLLRYATFVTFFPQLVAGPIIHHGELMPQFARWMMRSPAIYNLSIGIVWFSIGLAKKLLIADGLGAVAGPIFAHSIRGGTLTMVEAWAGALAYTGQIYFDFSGYSDMAIGLARMFGLRLPLNFLSPYKARSVIDFWRHWHITLSRFLRDYLYIPLGGNRRGIARRHLNLMATMILGGLWHGASWTFALWGALHGVFLIVNHAWRALGERRRWSWTQGQGWKLAAWALTFVCVTAAWVPFRTEDLAATWAFYGAMAGVSPMGGINSPYLNALDVALIGSALLIAFLAPNTWELMAGRSAPAGLRWRPTPAWSIAASLLLVAGIASMSRPSVFLYWQF